MFPVSPTPSGRWAPSLSGTAEPPAAQGTEATSGSKLRARGADSGGPAFTLTCSPMAGGAHGDGPRTSRATLRSSFCRAAGQPPGAFPAPGVQAHGRLRRDPGCAGIRLLPGLRLAREPRRPQLRPARGSVSCRAPPGFGHVQAPGAGATGPAFRRVHAVAKTSATVIIFRWRPEHLKASISQIPAILDRS